MGKILNGSEDTKPLINTLQIFVKHRQDNIKSDLQTIRRASIAPFAFCNKLVNNLQEIIKVKFSRNSKNDTNFRNSNVTNSRQILEL